MPLDGSGKLDVSVWDKWFAEIRKEDADLNSTTLTPAHLSYRGAGVVGGEGESGVE